MNGKLQLTEGRGGGDESKIQTHSSEKMRRPSLDVLPRSVPTVTELGGAMVTTRPSETIFQRAPKNVSPLSGLSYPRRPDSPEAQS